ncbi:hypothetical protein BS17DRAFT_807201 [Gyrodon lividus]|nr:hypothetical protein BS17DRAFT_807201 [Gyrodon lividus]
MDPYTSESYTFSNIGVSTMGGFPGQAETLFGYGAPVMHALAGPHTGGYLLGLQAQAAQEFFRGTDPNISSPVDADSTTGNRDTSLSPTFFINSQFVPTQAAAVPSSSLVQTDGSSRVISKDKLTKSTVAAELAVVHQRLFTLERQEQNHAKEILTMQAHCDHQVRATQQDFQKQFDELIIMINCLKAAGV